MFCDKGPVGDKSVTSQVIRNCDCWSIPSFVQVLTSLNSCLPQISGAPWVVHSSSPWTRSIQVVHGLGVSEMYRPLVVKLHYYGKLQKILTDLMCSIWHWNQSLSTESSSDILLSDLEGSIPLDSSLTQSLDDSQALIDLFPDSPTLNAVKMIISKLVQMEAMEISDQRNNYFFQNNGCWACDIYTAVQVWLRWPSDQPLDSPYSASLLWIKPVRMRITTIINWKILSWCTNKLSKLWCEENWRTMTKTENGEDMKSVQVYILIYKAKKKLNSSLLLGQWALNFCLPWASLGLLILNS